MFKYLKEQLKKKRESSLIKKVENSFEITYSNKGRLLLRHYGDVIKDLTDLKGSEIVQELERITQMTKENFN